MPYVTKTDRQKLDPALRQLIAEFRTRKPWEIAGLLNYVITKLVVTLWNDHKKYDTGNTLVGAMECAKGEFERRHLHPYEDGKINSQGDVEPFAPSPCPTCNK